MSYAPYGSPPPGYAQAPGYGGDPTAVMGRRYLAYIIDAILAGVIVAIVAGSLFFGSSHTISTGGDPNYCDSVSSSQMCIKVNDNEVRVISRGSFIGGVYGTAAVVWLLNMVLLEGLVGGTVGKLACGIRVVKHDGSVCGMGRALLRNVLLIVDAACFAIIGIVTSATTKGHRRVGDMAASTLVVPSRSSATRSTSPASPRRCTTPTPRAATPAPTPHRRAATARSAGPTLGGPPPPLRHSPSTRPDTPTWGRQAQRLHPVRHRTRHLARARHRHRRVEAHQPVRPPPANVL